MTGGNGYENVTVGCTVENQQIADYRLSIFSSLPVKHRNIILQPLLEAVNIEKYLDRTELVLVGGEYDSNARPFDYNWVLDVREQCIKHNVSFDFHQCGSNFIVDGNLQKLNYAMLYKRAKEFNINFKAQ